MAGSTYSRMIPRHTHRLILRELTVDDAKDMYELNRDPEVMKHTGDKAFESETEAKNFLANYTDYQRNGFGRWALVLKECNEVIGWCGLKKNQDGQVDIGYRLKKEHWNKGYATEAAKASISYGFQQLELDEIVGNASVNNPASIRVFEKIGMVFYKKMEDNDLGNAVRYIIKKT